MPTVFDAYPVNLRGFRFASLMDFSPLSKDVKRHLARVYGALAIIMFSAVMGVVVDMSMHIGGLITMLGSIIAMLYVMFTRGPSGERQSMLIVFGFLFGTLHGNLTAAFLEEAPEVLLLAVVCSVLMFVSLSVAAMFSNTRTMLYSMAATGQLAAIGLMLVFSMMFFPTETGANALVVISLLLSGLFVLVDTQMIIARAACMSERDYMTDAITLFVDFMDLLIKMLNILRKYKKKRDN